MASPSEILAPFLATLREFDWTAAKPIHYLKVLRFVREHRHLDPSLVAWVSETLGFDTWTLETLLLCSEEDTLHALEWQHLDFMGPGSNVRRVRDWPTYPTDGYFGDYLEYTLNSEGPLDYHFFTAAAMLGAACKRNFAFNFGHSVIWPSLWIVLLAPSGSCRKTSTINIGTRILRTLPDVNFITTSATPEALVEQLKPEVGAGLYDEMSGTIDFHHTNSQGIIAAPELGVFLGKQQYNEGLIQRLTDLSDNPNEWSSGTKKEGRSELRNVALSLVGGITPDSLKEALPRAAHGGGFMSRILWLHANNTPRVIPYPPAPSPLLKARLTGYLTRSWNANPATLYPSPDALEWFVEWYKALRIDNTSDDKMSGFMERKPTNLWRLASLLFLAQPVPEVEEKEGLRFAYITLELTQLAGQILDKVSESQHMAARVVDSSPVDSNLKYVRNALGKLSAQGTRKVQRSDLMRRVSSRLDRFELDRLLSTLQQSEEVTFSQEEHHGKTTSYYSVGPQFKGE
jgi:hypothetical protein